MKIRKGFVSNSSSSSFQCEYCHTYEVDESGDYGMFNMGFVECKNGHTICISHLSDENRRKYEQIGEDDEDFQYEPLIESHDCPLCQMELIKDSDLISYLLNETGKTKVEILKEIRKKAVDLSTFAVILKDGKVPEPIEETKPNDFRVIDLD